jgi:hypothetical protein
MDLQLGLAIPLHATTDELRDQLVPVKSLADPRAAGRREGIRLHGGPPSRSSTRCSAASTIRWTTTGSPPARELPSKVNIIPYNRCPLDWKRLSPEAVEAFAALYPHAPAVTVRHTQEATSGRRAASSADHHGLVTPRCGRGCSALITLALVPTLVFAWFTLVQLHAPRRAGTSRASSTLGAAIETNRTTPPGLRRPRWSAPPWASKLPGLADPAQREAVRDGLRQAGLDLLRSTSATHHMAAAVTVVPAGVLRQRAGSSARSRPPCRTTASCARRPACSPRWPR